jgi:hypothetical protein
VTEHTDSLQFRRIAPDLLVGLPGFEPGTS